MVSEERVVVKVVPEKLFNSGEKVYVTRVKQLGLTAYADSDEESWDKLKQMFRALVSVLRDEGALEARLNASGLEWCPESKYKGSPIIEHCDDVYNTSGEGNSGNLWERIEGELVVA